MNHNYANLAKAYYTAMSARDIAGIEKYLHPNVHFSGPLGASTGKEPFLEAAKRLMTLFKTLTIRATFGSENQAMVAYDLDFSTPIGNIHTAALLTFQDEFITKIELFFDARPFDKK